MLFAIPLIKVKQVSSALDFLTGLASPDYFDVIGFGSATISRSMLRPPFLIFDQILGCLGYVALTNFGAGSHPKVIDVIVIKFFCLCAISWM